MSRLFLGTFLPSEMQAVLGEVAQLNKELDKSWQCNLRWVREEKLHLTWLFLGKVEETRLPDLDSETLTLLKKRPKIKEITINYDSLQVWYSRGVPQLIV